MVDYVFANPKNVTDFPQMLQYFNNLTDIGAGGMLGIIFLILIGAILFLMMKAYKFESAITVSLLITSIFGILFRIIGLINDYALYVCIIFLVGSIYALMREAAKSDF